MAGPLENPIEYSSLQGSCICCNADKLGYLDEILLQAISSFSKMHERKGMTALPPEEMLPYIKSNFLLLFVDNKYLVGLDVVQAWFSPDRVLSEEFVYKYGEGTATMKDVTDAMVLVARHLDCCRVQVGTLAANNPLRHRALASAYEKAGFTTSAIALTRNT